MVYSYNSGSWEEQAGVEVVALGLPDAEEGHEVIEEEGQAQAHDDFEAAVERAEAARHLQMGAMAGGGKHRQPTARSRPPTGARSRPRTGVGRSRPATGSRSRPLTPLEKSVEEAVVRQVRSRPQTPSAPTCPAEAASKTQRLSRQSTPTSRPSTAARLLEKQRAGLCIASSRGAEGVASSPGAGGWPWAAQRRFRVPWDA